jgi:hypothetical protein
MNTQTDVNKHELLSCDVCIKEVPVSNGKVLEIDDYVMYFCGLECFDKWHKQAEHEKGQAKTK